MRILLASLILIGTNCLANGIDALAQGAVTSSCTFTSNTSGRLNATAINGQYVLDGGFIDPNNAARLGISYNGTPTVDLNAITSFTNSPSGNTVSGFDTGISFTGGGASADNNASALQATANNFNAGTKSITLSDTDTADTILVYMKAISPNPWKTGQYTAQTTITCN